jgi:glycosyltransferase involved in cell wall biosynthesis
MSVPFFSLIIPVYKTEKYIEECFTSLLKQTLSDFEAIIVNDGSPGSEGFPSAEDTYKNILGSDKRFKYIRQENLGVSAARNRGVNSSKGIFLKFLDSDDCLEPDHLLNLQAQLNKHKQEWNTAIFYLEQIRSFTSDEQGNKTFTEPHRATYNNSFYKELVYFGISGPKLLVSRNLVGNTRFREELTSHEEPDFYLRVYLDNRKQGNNIKFIGLNDDSYLYRLHQNSFTKQLEPKFNLAAVNVYKKLLVDYRNALTFREKILCRLGILRFIRDERISFYQKYTKKFFGLIAKILGRWWW